MNYEGLIELNNKFIKLSEAHKSLISYITQFFDEAVFCNNIITTEDNVSFYSFDKKYELNWNVFCREDSKYGELELYYSYTLLLNFSSGTKNGLFTILNFYIDSDGFIFSDNDFDTKQAFCNSEAATKLFRKIIPDAIYNSLLNG